MAKKMINQAEKLDKLKTRKKALEARIVALEAAKKTAEKKHDTRRKILLGAYFLEEATKTGKVAELFGKMDGFLKRNSDRVLFDLPPLPEVESPEQ